MGFDMPPSEAIHRAGSTSGKTIGIAYGSAEAKEEAERAAAAQSLGMLADMAGLFGFGMGSDLPPLRLSPPVTTHDTATRIARAEAKRQRRAAARREGK